MTPAPLPFTARALLATAVLLIGATIAPRVEAGAEIEILDLNVRSDTLYARFEIDRDFFNKLIETLERGLSATIKYTIELWVPRRGWFDRLVHSDVVSYKVRYDSWSEEYIVLGPHGELDAGSSPRQLSMIRAAPNLIPVGEVENLDPEKDYYINLNVQIQPLTVEEFREMEAWLRGTLGGSDPTLTSRTKGIWKGLFNLARSVTGFEDKVTGARSKNFCIRDLN